MLDEAAQILDGVAPRYPVDEIYYPAGYLNCGTERRRLPAELSYYPADILYRRLYVFWTAPMSAFLLTLGGLKPKTEKIMMKIQWKASRHWLMTAAAACGLALLPVAVQAASVNQAAPACALQGMQGGQPYQLQQFKNKVVYVDFWASWCGPCMQSFPFMNELSRLHKAQGLQVVAVNLDEETQEAEAFLGKARPDFTVVADPQRQCAKDFAVEAMPSSYLIDRQGRLRYIHKGFRPGEVDELRGVLKQLLDEPASL
jgi:thiol-disulfide isomerase/thioredoxin